MSALLNTNYTELSHPALLAKAIGIYGALTTEPAATTYAAVSPAPSARTTRARGVIRR